MRSDPRPEGAPGLGGEVGATNTHILSDAILIDRREAASMLRASISSIRALQRRGILPIIRIGKLARIRRTDVETWIARGCPMRPHSEWREGGRA